MWRAFIDGGRLAARCGPLTVTLWSVNLLYGAGFGLAAGYWLGTSLAGSLATRSLLKDLDPNVLIDLFYHHRESFRMLIVLALLLAITYFAIWIFLHATIIARVREERSASLADAFRQGLEWTGPIAILFLVATIVLGCFTSAIVFAAMWMLHLTASSPSEMVSYWILLGAAAFWCVGYVLFAAVHDHARIRACATESRAFSSYGWAFRFVLKGKKKAFLLACLLHLIGLALWALYQSVATTLPIAEGLGVAGSLLWGQAYLVARMLLRVWFFAAENDLQEFA